MSPTRPRTVAFLVVVLSLAGLLVVAGRPPVAAAPQPAPPPAQAPVSFGEGFAPVVARVAPTVVNITATKRGRETTGHPGFEPFHPFGPFGQFEPGPSRPERGLGSGVIVSADGFILTNNHVVQDADELRVSLADKREFKAKIIGTDPKTDIALVKIEANGLPAIAFGDSSKVKVGDFALAVGDPYGLGQTVTLGIVSAVGRGNIGLADYEDFIQTDAAINPGNSGGPLVNYRGELIGVNTAIVSRGAVAGNQGIGFAVPANLARTVMGQLRKQGRVVRGYLGVSIQEITPSVAQALGLGTTQGALVTDIVEGSPAAKASLQRYDVITRMNGADVADSRSLRLAIAETAPGSTVKLDVLRNGKTKDVSVQLTALPEKVARAGRGGGGGGESEPERLGLRVAPLTPDIRQELGLPRGARGVVVLGVAEGSRAAEAGLDRGDVIVEANRKPISGPAELDSALRAPGDRPVALTVLREGATRLVVLEP